MIFLLIFLVLTIIILTVSNIYFIRRYLVYKRSSFLNEKLAQDANQFSKYDN